MTSNVVRVFDADDIRLDNTTPRNAKQWLRSGRAVIISKNPFSVKLVDVKTTLTRPVLD